jgi:hypothetical protein
MGRFHWWIAVMNDSTFSSSLIVDRHTKQGSNLSGVASQFATQVLPQSCPIVPYCLFSEGDPLRFIPGGNSETPKFWFLQIAEFNNAMVWVRVSLAV